MEVFLFLILGVIGIAAFILPWINLFRHNAAHQDDWRLRRRIEVLETQIHDLLAEKDSISPPASTIGDEVQETSVSQPCEALKTEISEQILQEEDVPEAQPVGYEYFDEEQEDEYIEKSSVTASLPPSAAVHTPSPKKSAEFNFATRLSVWIGSVSLAFAAFFLVKLSYDAGLLGPETRIILGMLFGGGLVASSLFLSKNQKIPNALRISQGLAGAGLVSLCFSLYSAANIHHFISSMAGFTGMVAVVGATLVLSLRLGAPVALFGMIGGFVTPILFSTSEPNVTGLLGYLFVLFTSIQFLGSRRNWSAISYLSLIGVVLWVVSLLVWGHDRGFLDPSILSLFLLGICASSFAVHLFQSREIDDCAIHKASNASRLPAITIGVSSFLLLATQGTFGFGLFEWGITLVISLAIVALSVLRPKLYGSAVWVKFAIDAVTYGFYTDSVLYDQGSALVILSSLFVIYAVLPALIMAKMQVRPKYWSLVQVVSSLTLFLIARADFGSLSDMSPFAPWGVLAIGLSLFCLVQARLWVSRSHEDATSIIAYYALGCTSFLSLGMALILDEVYLPLAFAAEFAAVIGIHRKMQLNILPKIAYALLALVLVLSAEGLGDGISIMLSGITDKTIYLPYRFAPSLIDILNSYLLPGVFLALAYALHIPKVTFGKQNAPMSNILGGLALFFVVGGFYMILRNGAFMQGSGESFVPVSISFFERAEFTVILALLGVGGHALMKRASGLDIYRPSLRFLSNSLILLALLRIVFFDLLQNNPAFDGSQHVGSLVLLNGITLVYGLGMALCLYGLKEKVGFTRVPVVPHLYRGFTLLFLLLLVTLNIRQCFSPNILTTVSVGNVEMYLYSLAWLITGLGLLTYGIKDQDKSARIAAMIFITLTIGKVFLIDSSNLTGIFKVFSFLGLGVSLIGLSTFYTRYMSKLEPDETVKSEDK